ncbi:MAG: bifunctional oligoribonuclease/PAP phosphatase NrnA [Planctomycetota bacterium]
MRKKMQGRSAPPPSRVSSVNPPEGLVEALRRARRPLLLTHIYPDGDGYGCQLALHRAFRAAGVEAGILLTHPAPAKLHFLDGDGVVEVLDGEPNAGQLRTIEEADLMVILDTSDPERIGRLHKPVFSLSTPRCVVDHHLCEDHSAFDHVWSVPGSPATGNLVLRLLEPLSAELTPEIAEPLLAAIATDTGWYRFANATPEAFRDSATLIAAGADAEKLHRCIHETSSPSRTRVLGEVLARLDLDCDGRVVYSVLEHKSLDRHGVGREEIDGFIDALEEVGGSEILILVVELSPGRYKVSLRSKGDVDIHEIAVRFGGGGHAKASGCNLEGTEEEVTGWLLEAARELLGRQGEKLVPPAP